MLNHSQEPPAATKASNQDLKDMDVCFFNLQIETQNSKYGCLKDQWLYPNQDQYAKPKSGASSPHQCPKSGLQIEDREPKFGKWVYQRPVTISNSRSRCKNQVGNLQHPWKPQIRTSRTWSSLHLQNEKRAKNCIIGVSKTSVHIKSKWRCKIPSQEPPAPIKAPNMDVNKNGCSRHLQNRATIHNMGVLKLNAT